MMLQREEVSGTAIWMQEARHRAANLQHLATNVDRLLDRRNISSDDRPRMVRRAAALLRAYETLEASAIDVRSCAPEIRSIAGALVEMFGQSVGSVILVLDLQTLELEGERRRALLLAVSELVINALRHAFAGRRNGVIQICLYCEQAEGEASMRIADDGVGPDRIGSDGGDGGLGCNIIRGLARVLDGDVAWRRSPQLGGTEVVLTFPVGSLN